MMLTIGIFLGGIFLLCNPALAKGSPFSLIISPQRTHSNNWMDHETIKNQPIRDSPSFLLSMANNDSLLSFEDSMQHPYFKVGNTQQNDERELLQRDNHRNRFIFFARGTKTITITSTSVRTVTCSKSTTACAAGRRGRRQVLKEEHISTSITLPMEPTSSLIEFNDQNQDVDYGHHQLHLERNDDDVQLISSIDPLIHDFGSNNEPLMPQQYWAPRALQLFFNDYRQSTSYITITVFSLSTVTSTPGCSVPNDKLIQCPII